jgi:hypothetical protein
MIRNLGTRTYVTYRNIILNGFSYLWPPKIIRYKIHGFVEAKMSCSKKSHNGTRELEVDMDHLEYIVAIDNIRVHP